MLATARPRWWMSGLFVVAALGGTGCGYNTIQTYDEQVSAAEAQIKVQLQRRADLVPNLVETVKGYAKQEQTVFTEVAEARAKLAGAVQGGDLQQMAQANAALTAPLGRLLAIAESYPQLKSNENFRALQDQLEGTENRIAGQVSDQATGNPLAGARITIQRTALVTSSNAEGRYTLRNVPAGAITVRATFIGYAAATRGLTVAPGEAATADLALKLTPYTLDAVVSTVSGDQTRKETPNAISNVRTASLVQTRPITNMNDLLGARVPGVEVLPGNITGAGARVRIRGTSSLSLNNEPIYVIDGVRMESANNSSSIGIGGTNPSRVNDIDPNEIESYDVVKGPAASTLYGTAATNGVVVIKTKRGTPGPARFNVFAETGIIKIGRASGR